MRLTYRQAIHEAGRAYLQSIMDACQTQAEAGRIAGCDRKHFYWLLKRHDVPRKPIGRNDCARKVAPAVCQDESPGHTAR